MSIVDHAVAFWEPGGGESLIADRPAVTVLPDRTILAAALVDTGVAWVLRLWHLTGTGEHIESIDLPGLMSPILAPTGVITLLAAATQEGGNGSTLLVTTGPLTATPAASVAPIYTPGIYAAPLVGDDGMIHIVGSQQIVTLTPEGHELARRDVPSSVLRYFAGAWLTGGAIHAVSDDGRVLTAPAGAAPAFTGAASPWGGTQWAQAATNPAAGAWHLADDDPGNGYALTVFDAATGAPVRTISEAGPPGSSPGGSTPDEADGIISLIMTEDGTRTYWRIIHLRPDGTADVATVPTARQYSPLSYGAADVAHREGRWAALGASGNTWDTGIALQLFIGNLTQPTYDGILHIDTLTHTHWLVGTRDPDMDWRLHVDGLVEILAGQDDQATHRLRVCDGTEWPVAAYLRPE